MRYFWVSYVAVAVCMLGFVLFVGAPGTYPSGVVISVSEGGTIGSVGAELKERGAISSVTVFKVASRLLGGVQAGAYDLGDPASAVTLATRLARGDTGLAPVSVTIPEGTSVRDVLTLLERDIPQFDVQGFAQLAEGKEGYLFPDTYQFYPGAAPSVIIERFESRARDMLDSLTSDIDASGHTKLEILTMASILEKEARQFETMRTVSGILWKRIEIGMPLQVDAVFGYIYGTSTFSPSFDDLEIDSPYNTYKYRGLPPGPIGNPGLSAIKAALDPASSPYLYYLTGKDGTMHYARTFEQHVANRKHLR